MRSQKADERCEWLFKHLGSKTILRDMNNIWIQIQIDKALNYFKYIF